MTPDQLLLTPAVQSRLAAALANAGQPDGLQACIDEAAVRIAAYTRGYTVAAELVAEWTRLLALRKAYTAAGVGTPKDIERDSDAVLRELEAYRDGKFPGQLAANEPARSPGVAIVTTNEIDAPLR